MDLGQLIEARLIEFGMSKAELIRATGLSRETLRRILVGETENVRDGTVFKIEDALAWQRGSLLSGDPQPQDDADEPVTGPALDPVLDELQALQSDVKSLRVELQALTSLLADRL